jgi:hypothetical protein
VTWVAWRAQRAQLIAIVLFAVATGAFLAITGEHYAAVSAAMQRYCFGRSRATCFMLETDHADAQHLMDAGQVLVYLLPIVVGLALGAPLLARELASRTARLGWTQSVSRTRWLLGQLSIPVIVVACMTAALIPIADYWLHATQIHDTAWRSAVQPQQFDESGLVLVAYALFAFLVGVVIGAVIRNTGWTFVAGLLAFGAARYAIRTWVRVDLAPKQVVTYSLFQLKSVNPHALPFGWVMASGVAHVGSDIPITLTNSAQTRINLCMLGSIPDSCYTSLRYHYVYVLHSMSQYWWLQSAEALLFVLLAGALVGALLFAFRRAWIEP